MTHSELAGIIREKCIIGFPECTAWRPFFRCKSLLHRVCILLPQKSDFASLLRKPLSLQGRLIFDMLVQLDYI